MKLTTRAGNLEGTPAEIAEVLHRLGTPAESTRLRDPPTNELLQHEYATDTGLSPRVRAQYAAAVRELDRRINPRSLLDATVDDIRALERDHALRCAHRATSSWPGQARGGGSWTRCRQGLYTWTVQAPAGCSQACKLWEAQAAGPLAVLKGLRHFFGWLRDRGLRADDPVEPVARRHVRSQERGGGPRKYAPSVDEVRALAHAHLARGRLTEAGLVLALASLGRRPGHVRLLHAEDLHLDGIAYVDFDGVRRRQRARNRGAGTKLVGNLISPVPGDFAAWLRDTYLPWRARRFLFSSTEGPLFPGSRGGYYPYRDFQTRVVDAAITDLETEAGSGAEAWRSARDPRSRRRVSPGCFRHFFTTTLADFGVPRDERMILRGDVVPGAEAAYRHLSVPRLANMLRLPSLIPVDG